ncbi:MAG TPA: LysE family translocator [Roseiarcus sp.]|jgi:threonine/homoserine/homoserine lactone efflux protein
MSLSVYFTFLLACIVVVIVPGPTVTLIVANSLRHGRRAGMLNVAGTQLGLVLTVGIVLLGLASLIAAMGAWFIWLRLVGAAYLIWLGCKLLMASGEMAAGAAPRTPRAGFFVQGLAVALSNPKTLLFFGAFFPQFMDPNRDFTLQVLIMGATAMAVAAISDSAYALLASRAGAALSRRRVRLMTRASGGMLIGGGVWLALSRTK